MPWIATEFACPYTERHMALRVPFINTHIKLHKALKMSAQQAAEMCSHEEVPEDVHFELLFDAEIDWDACLTVSRNHVVFPLYVSISLNDL